MYICLHIHYHKIYYMSTFSQKFFNICLGYKNTCNIFASVSSIYLYRCHAIIIIPIMRSVIPNLRFLIKIFISLTIIFDLKSWYDSFVYYFSKFLFFKVSFYFLIVKLSICIIFFITPSLLIRIKII